MKMQGLTVLILLGAFAQAAIATELVSIIGWGDNYHGQCNGPSGTGYTAVAGGYQHSLALRADGSIAAWGNNYYGQVTPPSGTNYVAIAAGGFHGLALRADGSIAGWGSNYAYVNGSEVWTGQATPPSGDGFVAIAAGNYHSLALRADGSIVGWGSNSSGQATPPSGTGFRAIACGLYHSLALRVDGSIVAWGSNYDGERTPPSGAGFTAIAAGFSHGLALRADGRIVCWGSDILARATPSGAGFKAVASGAYHCLALRSDGTIICWGMGEFGQTRAPSGTTFVSIAGGVYHSLALWTDSVPPSPDPMTWELYPYAMGTSSITMTASTASDSSGAEYYFHCVSGGGHDSGWQTSRTYVDTGLSAATEYQYAVQVRDLSSGRNVTGWSATKAATTYAVANTDATPPTPDPMEWVLSPTEVRYGSITMIARAAGDVGGTEYYFECIGGGGHDSAWQSSTSYTDTALSPSTTYTYTVKARDRSTGQNQTTASAPASATTPAVRQSGEIRAWGSSIYSQTTPPSGTDYIAVAAGLYHGLALRANGSIVGWGSNIFGETTTPSATSFVAIAGGTNHTLALQADGNIVGWGLNEHGQADWPSGADFVAIAAGWFHSLALRADGSMVGWGYNAYGQATPPSGTGYTAISAGYYHNLALRADGSVAGWGLFGSAAVPSGTGYKAIAAGGYHSLALRADGSIVAWGDNTYGQATPPAGTGFVAIAAGQYHSLALKGDGRIVGWGNNAWGQAVPPSGGGFTAIDAGGYYSLALWVDSTPPSPDPITWSVSPYAVTTSSITMQATTAIDVSGVEYYFTCTGGSGHDSGWQNSATYTDVGLQQGLTYSYTVKARDKSLNQNETAPSAETLATIPELPPAKVVNLAPADNSANLDIAVNLNWSSADGATGYDVYIGTTSSLSLADKRAANLRTTTYSCTLGHSATYYWRIDSVNVAGTTTGDTWRFSTIADTFPPVPDPMTWSIPPHAASPTSVAMVATTAIDSSGVEYYFTCVSDGGHDSGWQNSSSYTDVGLEQRSTYSYMVRARDKSANHNETASSPVATATTPPFLYRISGYVRFSDGTGIPGVTMTADGVDGVVSNTLGYYSVTVPDGWSGTVTPHGIHIYTPACRDYTDVTSDIGDQHYTGRSPDQLISGMVRDTNGFPVTGVTLTTQDGYSCVSDANGYVLGVHYGWFGTVTPSLSGYYFIPASLSYSAVTTPRTGQDYLAERVPVLETVIPSDGPCGSHVVLTGCAFGATAGSVRFGGVSAAIREWTPTSIRCIVPSGAETGDVVVTNSDLVAGNPMSFAVTAPNLLRVNRLGDETRQNGTAEYPFTTIAEAIAVALDGAVIEVDDGIYTGPHNRSLDTLGKAITVRSASGPGSCIIDCNGLDRGFYIHCGEDANTVIEGFTVLHGYDGGLEASVCGSGIALVGSSPTIRNCVISDCSGLVGGMYCDSGAPLVNNCIIAHNSGYIGGIYAVDSSLGIANCTIADNAGEVDLGGGILYDSCDAASIVNTILWGNSPCELLSWGSTLSVRYCCVAGGYAGEGNIHDNPMFVDANNRDYHLLSGSPCIDAGDPASDFSWEPLPNGGRVNIGAYGNTLEATRSGSDLISAAYQVVAIRRLGRTIFEYDCKVVLTNNSEQTVRVTQFELLSVPANMSVVDADVSIFDDIPAGGSATSEDTCTFRVDRSVPADESLVTWQVTYDVIGSGEAMQVASCSLLDLEPQLVGDVSGNGVVDFDDLGLLAQQWLGEPGVPSADIAPAPAGDGVVNFLDYAAFAASWAQDANQ